MSTLDNAPHRPFPGVNPGTTTTELAQVLAQLDALEAHLRHTPAAGAITAPWEILEFFRALKETPLDTEP